MPVSISYAGALDQGWIAALQNAIQPALPANPAQNPGPYQVSFNWNGWQRQATFTITGQAGGVTRVLVSSIEPPPP